MPKYLVPLRAGDVAAEQEHKSTREREVFVGQEHGGWRPR